jgi:HEXXH motif-containing protein
MKRLPPWALGYSCPQEKFDADIAAEIATGYAKEYTARFLQRFGGQLETDSPGLVPFLQQWNSHNSGFEDVWDVALGYARRTFLFNDHKEAPRQAAWLGLRLAARGAAGEWEATLPDVTRLRWDNWLLPPARRLCLRSDGKRTEIDLKGGDNGHTESAVFERNGHGWRATGPTPLPVGRFYGCRLVLLPEQALDGLSFGAHPTMSRLRPEQILAKCRKALGLLKRHAPAYLPWVQRVLRGIVPVHAMLSELRSGSDFDKPGIIQASFPSRTIAMAETFVHECSHQYFQILCRVGPVEDGTDKTLYYSPVRGTGRPLDKILLAYHAFANVLLFYRMCRESGFNDGGYLDRNEPRLIAQLKQLEAPLRTTKGLTERGDALWRPLARRVRL